MGYHAGVPGLQLGWLGVDLFFVLSGFLITTLLLEERSRTGTISLPRFWGRRFLRLMPAYMLYAAGLTLAMLVFHVGTLQTSHGWSPADLIRAIWLYYYNYLPVSDIWSYQHLAAHLWSLAVEEQFYLVWPILLVLGLRLGVAEAMAWGLALAIAANALLSDRYEFNRLEFRGLAMVLGCAFAIRLYRDPILARIVSRPIVVGGAAVMAVVIMAAATFGQTRGVLPQGWGVLRWLSPAFCPVLAAFIGGLWYGADGFLPRLLSLRPLQYLGRISYGLYLYHILVQYMVWHVILTGFSSWNPYIRYGLRLAVYAGLTVAIASLSYRLVEIPFLRLKSRLEPRPAPMRPERPAVLIAESG